MHSERNKLSELTAVILAGGYGTRLRKVVCDRPKVLADVNGRPFLSYLLDRITAVGIRYVILCTGYLSEKIHKIYGDRYDRLHLGYSVESSPLGTAGALRLALPIICSNEIIVFNGDSFCHEDLNTFWQWHHRKRSEVSLLLTKIDDTKRYGRVEVDERGNILRFSEKNAKPVPGWINAGIYLMKTEKLADIPANRFSSLEKDIFPIWIEHGIYGYKSNTTFLDIGTPESYATANQFFKAHLYKPHIETTL